MDAREAATQYFQQNLQSPEDLPFRLTTVAL
jgi:hypothetical protein